MRRGLVCSLGAASASKPPRAIPALEPALGSHPCGALSAVRVPSTVHQTFRPKGVKSQGFGASVPDSIDALFLLFVAPLIEVTCPGRSQPASGSRSEERRVGKECRSR